MLYVQKFENLAHAVTYCPISDTVVGRAFPNAEKKNMYY